MFLFKSYKLNFLLGLFFLLISFFSYSYFSQSNAKYHNSSETTSSNPQLSIINYQSLIPQNIELPCPESSLSSPSVIRDSIANPVDQSSCLAKFSVRSPDPTTDEQIEEIISYQELLKQVLSKLPYHLWQSLDNVTFSFETDIPRGSANSHKIILRLTNIDEEQFVAVLIHELGHIADIGGFQGTDSSSKSPFLDGQSPIYTDDLSVEFYSSYWEDSEKIIEAAYNDNNFISGYSQKDPFEHFAETFLTYVLHNELLKTKNIEQYNFFRDEVFMGYIFEDFSEEEDYTITPYDSTKLQFDLTGFLEN